MTIQQRRYGTPQAERAAVTERLRTQATQSPWGLDALQRQYAYDQLVERLYRLDEGWIIKGATALLARRISFRHTLDIDVYRAGAIADAERQMRDAALLDIGEWMRFEVGASVRLQAAGAQAVQVQVQAFIGAKAWAVFQVDIVAGGIRMTGEPEMMPPLTSVQMGDQERRPWLVYPLVDHVADKVCAIIERHAGRPSTRFKDLVDLVAITKRCTVPADTQMDALAKEAQRRRLVLPESFDVPDRALWIPGYGSEARRTVGLDEVELEDALAIVRSLIDPLLSGVARGKWHPASQRWE